MIEIEFSFNGKEITILSNENEYIKDIFKRFSTEASLDIKTLYFLYEGYKINDKLTLSQIININDKRKKKMKILVNSINFQNSYENHIISNIKEVICPKCGYSIKIKIKDYKIILYDCKQNHETNISMNKYDETQKINLSNIKCSICNIKNKGITYNNEFYKCLNCNINICPLCKSNHNNKHNIINYNKKKYYM